MKNDVYTMCTYYYTITRFIRAKVGSRARSQGYQGREDVLRIAELNGAFNACLLFGCMFPRRRSNMIYT